MGCIGVIRSYRKRASRRTKIVLFLYPLLYSLLFLFDLYIEYGFAYIDSEIIGLNDPSRIPYGPFRYALTWCWILSPEYPELSALTVVATCLFPICIWRFIVLSRSTHGE